MGDGLALQDELTRQLGRHGRADAVTAEDVGALGKLLAQGTAMPGGDFLHG